MSDTEGERPQEVLESPREPDEDEAVGTASSNVSGNISVKREGTKEESSEALAPKRPRRRLEFSFCRREPDRNRALELRGRQAIDSVALLPFPDLSQPFPRIGIASSSEDEQSSDDDSDKFRIGGRSLAQRRVSRPSPYSETPQEPDEDESASENSRSNEAAHEASSPRSPDSN